MQEEPKEDRWSAQHWRVVAGIAAAGVAALAIVVATTSSNPPTTNSIALTGGDGAASSPGTVNCPTVADKLPAVPASAAAEVQRNLTLLQTQINEANNRLVATVGQGGPNFVQNAILGPLEDKRVATVNRIATAIGRTAARPAGLEALAPCTLNKSGVAQSPAPDPVISTAPAADPATAPAASAPASSGSNAGTGSVPTVNCPTVADKLPAVPASAAAEVQRNLTLLQTQITEANNRLVSTVGQGGPNFIQNAILGPLEDKRVATVNRIATAIGRTAARPAGLEALAPCTLNESGAVQSPAPDPVMSTAPAASASASSGSNAGTGSVPTVNCPTVADKLPAVPASAAAEVQRNLTLLQTQISEANNRLVSTVGQGGPNFIQNAILGPLQGKRSSTIDRIAIAIGRTAARPTGLDALAACSLSK